MLLLPFVEVYDAGLALGSTLRWLEPMIDEVFRPAGLSLAWYENHRDTPANPAPTLDVWFHGNCCPTPARVSRGSPLDSLRMGWVLSRDGRIAEDVNVDCALVMQLANAQIITTNLCRHLGTLDAGEHAPVR